MDRSPSSSVLAREPRISPTPSSGSSPVAAARTPRIHAPRSSWSLASSCRECESYPTGSAVGFPNQDPFRHNVFSKSGPSEFDLGLYGRGDSKDARVERAGVYPVFCNIHAKMVAFIVAVPTPYVAQPNPDGRFTIAGVPAGTYTVHAWHDRGGERSSEVTIAADGRSDVTVQLDASGYRPHATQEQVRAGVHQYRP